MASLKERPSGGAIYGAGSASSYLASGDELERAQRAPHVGDVGLEVVERIGDARLDLGRVLPRGAIGSDLVQGRRRHVGDFVEGVRGAIVVVEERAKFVVVKM